jgi:hypothetical protein
VRHLRLLAFGCFTQSVVRGLRLFCPANGAWPPTSSLRLFQRVSSAQGPPTPLLPYKKNVKVHPPGRRRHQGRLTRVSGPTHGARYRYPSRAPNARPQQYVKMSFLNGDLYENVYMTQLKDFVIEEKENLGCHLTKFIYGLKHASR